MKAWKGALHCVDSETAQALLERRLPAKQASIIYRHASTCTNCQLLIADVARPQAEEEILDPQLVAQIEWRLRSWQFLGRVPFTVSKPLEQGDIIDGRYLVVRRVGDAGLGAIYEAYDPQKEDRVVLKMLHLGSPEAAESSELLDITRALTEVSHPNVLRVHSVGTHGEQVFIVSEFIKGTSLASACHGSMPYQRILDLFIQAGRGLAAAHEAGITHGCFTPNSCIDGLDGRVRVLDFGIAECLSAAADAQGSARPTQQLPRRRTTDSFSAFNPEDSFVGYLHRRQGRRATTASDTLIMGAPLDKLGHRLYVAPERLHGAVAGPTADQFAFCAALFTALYESPPFAGDTIASWLREVLLARVRPIPRKGVPESVHTAILRGLRKDPAERHKSMNDLLDRLGGVSRRPSRRTYAAVAVAAVFAFALAGVAVGTLGARDSVTQCVDTDEPGLVGVWDTPRKQALRKVVLGHQVTHGNEQWVVLERALDGYAGRWQTEAQVLCESGAPDQATRACMAQGREGLQTLLATLTSGSIDTLSRGAAAVRALPDPRQCRDVARVSPAGASWAGDLASAEILYYTGSYAQARQRAARVYSAARESGGPDWQARADHLRGVIAAKTGDLADAERYLTRAVWTAQAHGHDRVAIDAALRLLAFAHEPAQRDYWQQYVRATLARMGGDKDLEAKFNHAVASSLAGQGMFREATSRQNQAISHYSTRANERPASLADALYALGNYQLAQGTPHAALNTQRKAQSMYQLNYGPMHPNTASAQVAVADSLIQLGQTEAARNALRDATARLKEMRRGVVARAQAYAALSRMDRARGRYNSAVELAESAVEEYEAALGGAHPLLADALLELGEVMLLLRKYRGAVSVYQQAVAIWETSGRGRRPSLARGRLGAAIAGFAADPTATVLPRGLSVGGDRDSAIAGAGIGVESSVISNGARSRRAVGEDENGGDNEDRDWNRGEDRGEDAAVKAWAFKHLGDALLARGDHQRALLSYQRALALWRGHTPKNDARTIAALGRVGLAQLELGRRGAARKTLERALAAAERTGIAETPEIQYALARALWRDRLERERARKLAVAAATAFRARGQHGKQKARQVSRWLRRRADDKR